MNAKRLKISAAVGISILFFVAGIYAKTMPDVIKLEDAAYKEHTKGVVEFTHGKHQKEYAQAYPDLYQNGCGECHHNDKGEPLSSLQEGDSVQKCIACHKIASDVPQKKKKEWREKKLSKEEKKKLGREYHAEALHQNCKACHKAFNKKYKPQKAPTTCKKCHPKKE
jgi:hypothetical protein